MNQIQLQKISLLAEMIAFATVDGRLHPREYEFLSMVADHLQIEKHIFDELFHSETQPEPIKSQKARIEHFYRLALLMHADGVLHEKEQEAIRQIAINMGLNPNATRKVLSAMEATSGSTINPQLLYDAFREQSN